MTSAPFLEVRDVRKHYGAIKAVDGVSFRVGPGEIVGVIGPNGSGKTTLFNAILGQIRPTSGGVEFCGEDITGMSPLELARRGIGRTFQTLQVFGGLSVRDNLIVAAQEFKGTMPGRLFAKPDAARLLREELARVDDEGAAHAFDAVHREHGGPARLRAGDEPRYRAFGHHRQGHQPQRGRRGRCGDPDLRGDQ